MPVSRTRTTRLVALGLHRDRRPPAARGVLDGVLEQVADHLLQPHRVAHHADRPRRWPPRARCRCRGRAPPCRARRGSARRRSPRSTGRRWRTILPRVTRETSSRSSTIRARWRVWRIDDLPLPHRPRLLRADLVEHPEGVADGGQRVAQLVAEHGQELVLAAVGVRLAAQQVADLVLAAAGAQRRLHGADQRRQAHRPLQEGDVAERHQGRRGPARCSRPPRVKTISGRSDQGGWAPRTCQQAGGGPGWSASSARIDGAPPPPRSRGTARRRRRRRAPAARLDARSWQASTASRPVGASTSTRSSWPRRPSSSGVCSAAAVSGRGPVPM